MAFAFLSSQTPALGFDIIPSRVKVHETVTIVIDVEPGGEARVTTLANRVDSDNDGVIDTLHETPRPTARPQSIVDSVTRDAFARDKNPQPGRIELSIDGPELAGEYSIEVRHGDEVALVDLAVYADAESHGSPAMGILSRIRGFVSDGDIRSLLVALRDDRVESERALWIIGDAGVDQRLAANLHNPANPSWSPPRGDGERLAFSASVSRDAPSDIWMASIDSPKGPARVTTSEAHDRSPVWASDGASIAFLRGDAVIVIDVGSRVEKTLFEADGISELLLWDSENDLLTYREESRIWVYSAAANQKTQLAYHPLWQIVKSTRWNGDTFVISKRSPVTGTFGLFRSDAKGELRYLTRRFSDYDCLEPALSRDGSVVAFIVAVPNQ